MRSKFQQKVVDAVLLVPKGYVVSYGQIAVMIGCPRCAIQVGQTLRIMEEASIPWWRVINSQGRISIKGNKTHDQLMQKRLLEKDGVFVSSNLDIDIEKYRFRVTPQEAEKLNLSDDSFVAVMNKYGL